MRNSACWVVLLLLSAFGAREARALSNTWTLMFYWDADSDLEASIMPILKDFENHRPRWPASDLNIVVLVDRKKNDCTARGSWCFDGEKGGDQGLYMYQTSTGAFVRYVAGESEVDMGSWATLGAYVTGAVRKFPADNYALVLKDHGVGWVKSCLDDSDNSEMSLSGLVSALGQFATQQTAAGKKAKLDVLAFDACLMGELEVAAAVAPYVDRYVASADLTAPNSWSYGNILGEMPTPSATTSNSLAEFFVWKFGDPAGTSCRRDLKSDETSLASVYNVENAGAAWDELNALAAKILQTGVPRETILKARAAGFPYGCEQEPGLCVSELIDVTGFTDALASMTTGDVKDAAEKASRAAQSLVACTSSSATWKNVGGISAYFPCDMLDQNFSSYERLALTRDSPWLALISAFRQGGCGDQPIPQGSEPAVVAIGKASEQALKVTGALKAAGEPSARHVLLSVLANVEGFPSLGGLPIPFTRVHGADSPLGVNWDGKWVHLRTGPGPGIPCCIRHLVYPHPGDSEVIGDVPILWTPAYSSYPEFLTLRLLLRRSPGEGYAWSGKVLAAVSARGRAARLVRPRPGDLIQTVWPRLPGSGAEWSASAPLLLSHAEPLKVEYLPLAPGLWRVGHLLEGYGGVRYPTAGFPMGWPTVDLFH